MQLFITLVAWAAGLSLVIGSIVLVATVTAPRHATPPIKLAPQDNSLRPVHFGSQQLTGDAAKRPSHQVVAAFSGHGSRRTAQFNVKAKLPWQLRWTYSCARRASTGQFTVLRADMAAGREIRSTGIEEDATSGHGSAWFRPSSHQHYLVVISACSWHIKVVQAA